MGQKVILRQIAFRKLLKVRLKIALSIFKHRVRQKIAQSSSENCSSYTKFVRKLLKVRQKIALSICNAQSSSENCSKFVRQADQASKSDRIK